MPIVENIILEPHVDLRPEDDFVYSDYEKALASWTGTPNYLTYVFYNGSQVYEPIDFGIETNRSYVVPWNPDVNQVLTIIEEPEGAPVDPIDYKIEEYPVFYWWPSKDRDVRFYRVYKQILEAGNFEELEQDINHVDGYSYFAWRPKSPFDVENGKWYHMRIESFNEKYATESTSEGFNIFLHGFPEIQNDVEIIDGSTAGLFDITITK